MSPAMPSAAFSASVIFVVVTGVSWVAGSAAAVTLSVVGWRRTGRPFFAGAAWCFALGFLGSLAAGLAGMLAGVLVRIAAAPQAGTVFVNLFRLLFGTLLPAAGLVLLWRGARADAARAAGGDGGGDPHRRTHAVGRGLTVYFVLILVAAVGRQLIAWVAPALISYWIATAGLPAVQATGLAALLSIPFGLASLAAWLLLAWLVVREFPWEGRA